MTPHLVDLEVLSIDILTSKHDEDCSGGYPAAVCIATCRRARLLALLAEVRAGREARDAWYEVRWEIVKMTAGNPDAVKWFRPHIAIIDAALASPSAPPPQEKVQEAGPIPMVLHCPACHFKHIDAPEPERGWLNPPHKSHLCHICGCIWRPADVPTTGVHATAHSGEKDTWTWIGEDPRAPAPPVLEEKAAPAACQHDHEGPCAVVTFEKAAQEAGEETAALKEGIRARLRDHYLTGIQCDEHERRDRPTCSCSAIDLGWHPSVGAAVDAWITHALGEVIEPAAGAGRGIPRSTEATPGAVSQQPGTAPAPKRHKCMSCGKEFDCPHGSSFQAKYDVLPRYFLPDGTLVDHCAPLPNDPRGAPPSAPALPKEEVAPGRPPLAWTPRMNEGGNPEPTIAAEGSWKPGTNGLPIAPTPALSEAEAPWLLRQLSRDGLITHLRAWANQVAARFGFPLYLVGSALADNKSARDVDVVCVLPDAVWEARYGIPASRYEWTHVPGVQWSVWLAECSKTNARATEYLRLPIDFKPQPTTGVKGADGPRLRIDNVEQTLAPILPLEEQLPKEGSAATPAPGEAEANELLNRLMLSSFRDADLALVNAYAARVRSEERERCAKIALNAANWTGHCIAKAIRARASDATSAGGGE